MVAAVAAAIANGSIEVAVLEVEVDVAEDLAITQGTIRNDQDSLIIPGVEEVVTADKTRGVNCQQDLNRALQLVKRQHFRLSLLW
jgi:hypothetical protein